jgi:hypothetical protein
VRGGDGRRLPAGVDPGAGRRLREHALRPAVDLRPGRGPVRPPAPALASLSRPAADRRRHPPRHRRLRLRHHHRQGGAAAAGGVSREPGCHVPRDVAAGPAAHAPGPGGGARHGPGAAPLCGTDAPAQLRPAAGGGPPVRRRRADAVRHSRRAGVRTGGRGRSSIRGGQPCRPGRRPVHDGRTAALQGAARPDHGPGDRGPPMGRRAARAGRPAQRGQRPGVPLLPGLPVRPPRGDDVHLLDDPGGGGQRPPRIPCRRRGATCGWRA